MSEEGLEVMRQASMAKLRGQMPQASPFKRLANATSTAKGQSSFPA